MVTKKDAAFELDLSHIRRRTVAERDYWIDQLVMEVERLRRGARNPERADGEGIGERVGHLVGLIGSARLSSEQRDALNQLFQLAITGRVSAGQASGDPK